MKAIVWIKEVNNKAWQVINFRFSYKLQNKYEGEKGNPCNDLQCLSQERKPVTSLQVRVSNIDRVASGKKYSALDVEYFII